MVDEKEVKVSLELVSYIEKELEKGVSEDAIKKKLLGVGHHEHVIHHHLRHVRHKKHNRHLLFASIVVIALLVLIFIIINITSQEVKTSGDGEVLPEPYSVRKIVKEVVVECENYTGTDKTGCELEISHQNQLDNIRLDTLAFFKALNSGSTDACKPLSGYSKDSCVDASKIKNLGGVEKCSSLKTPYAQEYCKTFKLFEKAEQTRDLTLCDDMIIPRGYSQTCREVLG
ncbi:MAG: hypothetical protein KJ583_01065 [Nanoarchaeota archaeon]|nr:hypothetical protein [Nanoarchaeota archaeon]MBU1269490.1 hypothetical protein [Nanoarchaeota archaeon]MBU1603881.1 hypothetical protein [Nanoarchaeota archaeon]MBU2443347.1 hypothetical protein [Nanoarchaeota archaeon]